MDVEFGSNATCGNKKAIQFFDEKDLKEVVILQSHQNMSGSLRGPLNFLRFLLYLRMASGS